MAANYQGRYEYKKPRRAPLWQYLCYLLVATVLFTGVTISSYRSTASAEDSARVAKFAVTASGADQTFELSPGGESQQYSFTVKNTGEVTIRYQVRFYKGTTQYNLSTLGITCTTSVSGKTATGGYFTLAPGAADTVKLTFAPGSATADATALTVSVYAEQVD